MADQADNTTPVSAQAKAERYRAIAVAVEGGRTMTSLAREHGLSVTRVSDIVKRHRKAKQAANDGTWRGAFDRGEISMHAYHRVIDMTRDYWTRDFGEISPQTPISYVKAFFEDKTNAELLRYPGLGKKTIAELKAFFAAYDAEAAQ